MREDDKAVEAEEYRRSHCDRKERIHQCFGAVKIMPGMLMLDCTLCGAATEELRHGMELCDAARTICKVLGFKWEQLGEDRQKQIMIELTALAGWTGKVT